MAQPSENKHYIIYQCTGLQTRLHVLFNKFARWSGSQCFLSFVHNGYPTIYMSFLQIVFVDNLLNNKIIILFNLAEYRRSDFSQIGLRHRWLSIR